MRRATALFAAAALLVGCGGHGGGGGALTTQQFKDQADAACQRLTATVQAVPTPKAGDLAATASSAQAFVTDYQDYLDQLTPLVARAPDAAMLQQRWITPQTSEFAAAKPLLLELATDARAGDTAGVAAVAAKIAALPTTTTAVQEYQRQYGVGDCATLLSAFQG